MTSDTTMDGRQAACHHTAFSLVLACSRACLIPFITVYFRQLGLNAIQVGVVFALQQTINSWWSPVWMHTAIRLDKRRLLLMFSLLVAAFSPVALTYVPSMPGTQYSACTPIQHNMTTMIPNFEFTSEINKVYVEATKSATTTTTTTTTTTMTAITSKTKLMIQPTFSISDDRPMGQDGLGTKQEEKEAKEKVAKDEKVTKEEKVTKAVKQKYVQKTSNFTKEEIAFLKSKGIRIDVANKMNITRVKDLIKTYLHNHEIEKNKPISRPESSLLSPKFIPSNSGADQYETGAVNYNDASSSASSKSKEIVSPNEERGVAADSSEFQPVFSKQQSDKYNVEHRAMSGGTKKQYDQRKGVVPRSRSRKRRNLLSLTKYNNTTDANTTSRPHTKRTALQLAKRLGYHIRSISPTLFYVLLIICMAECFSLPIERFVSALWFNYQDNLDAKSTFQGRSVTSMLALSTMPLVVAWSVVNSDCILRFSGTSRFSLHVYASCAFGVLAFLMAYCYPIVNYRGRGDTSTKSTTGDQRQYHRGQQLMFFTRDVHLLSFAVSSIILELTRTSSTAFLFWRVYDLGGDEVTMAMTLCSGALCELLFTSISRPFVKRFGCYGSMSLALVICCIQFAGYSMVTSPNIIIGCSALSGLQSTFAEGCLSSHPELKSRRSRIALRTLETGFSRVTGHLMFGWIYFNYGSSMTFMWASIVAGIWLILFTCLMHICRQSEDKERYIRLLQESDDDDEDDIWPKTMKDDWLEKATNN